MKRLLIVDDQADLRELMRVTLEMEGYEVHEAHDGESALRAIGQLCPDLVLLDVMMPGRLDGLEVCRAVRADARHARVKVVMLSARGQQADQAAGLLAGADAYLAKPFSPRQLLQLIGGMV